MIRGGTMWDQTDGCAKQYRCSIAYYMVSLISKSYQIVLDRSVDTPRHGEDVVGGFNASKKQYLSTCFRMHITPEVDNIYSKRMRVDDMTKKGEVIFAKECKRLLYLCVEVGTKVNKKH